jgi:hypothetical protein
MGAAVALLSMLGRVVVDAQDNFVLHLFPAWPSGSPASFSRLRMRGGFVTSAAVSATGVVEPPVRIQSDAGRTLLIPSGVFGSSTANDTVCNGGVALPRNNDEQHVLATSKGERVALEPCAAS